MADYRADIVEADGTVVRTIDLVCPNDDIAIEHANSLGYPAVELWRDGRQIAKISYKPQIQSQQIVPAGERSEKDIRAK